MGSKSFLIRHKCDFLTFSFNSHNDFAMHIDELADGQLALVDISQNLTNHPLWQGCGSCHTDIPRLRAGMVGAQVRFYLFLFKEPLLMLTFYNILH
jgi:hypothetical protein